jgi:hypothetical protein
MDRGRSGRLLVARLLGETAIGLDDREHAQGPGLGRLVPLLQEPIEGVAGIEPTPERNLTVRRVLDRRREHGIVE